jgi:hypothetical protein
VDELSPDALRRTVTFLAETLASQTEADWSVGAGELEWTCRKALEHSIDVLLWYAGNLATLSSERRQHVRDGDPPGSIGRLLDALVSSGHILARVAEATPSGGRGYHGAGMADAAGFIAMGCDEALVHGRDICMGLGVDLRPPSDICAGVLRRLFPWAPEHDDPWERLLWCNGRIDLPGHERLGPGWGWWSRPLAEWDGTPYTDRWPGE